MIISKKGFTIAEMMVCFAVIGLLASMLIPSIIFNRPNRSMAMVRKAYQITERTVAELIFDDDLFPADTGSSNSFAFFDPDADAASPDARTQARTGRFFCEQFAAKLNTNDRIDCNTSKSFGDGPSFTTNDGINWYIQSGTVICDPDADPSDCNLPAAQVPDCPRNGKSPFICVYFDVNGNHSPNEVANTNDEEDDKQNADRGWFYVYWNGKVVAPRGQITRYLQETDVLNNKVWTAPTP